VNRGAGRSFVVAALCTLAGGCAVGPDFHPPAAPATPRYTAQPLDSGSGQRLVEGRDIPAEWWGVFHSAELDSLVRRALSANPDVQAADAALHAARENVLAQQAAFWPTADVQYSPTRQSIADPLASPLASGSNAYSLHTAQLNIAYVPDVFGGNRRQVEALQAEAGVQRFQLEAAHLSLAANLVQAVIQQASTRAQIETTHELIALSSEQLDRYRLQQQLGQIGAADVAAQQAALAQVQAGLPPLEKLCAQQAHQIAVLSGSLPGDAPELEITLEALRLPDELPLSLPSRLVEQRPDIRAAEEQLHGASAAVGVALANRLPSLSLTASGGSASLQFSQLFSAGTGFWSLTANVVQPVFDAGSLMHRQRAAEALLSTHRSPKRPITWNGSGTMPCGSSRRRCESLTKARRSPARQRRSNSERARNMPCICPARYVGGMKPPGGSSSVMRRPV